MQSKALTAAGATQAQGFSARISVLLMRLLAFLPVPLRRLLEGEDGRSGLSALFTFGVRIASALIIFISQVLMARWLGAHDFGIYTFVWVVVNVAGTLASIGLSVSAVRFLNEYLEHRKPALARGYLRFGRLVVTGVGALVAAGGILLFQAVPDVIEADFRLPLMVGLLALPAFALTDFHDGTGRARSWFSLAFLPPYILRPLLLLAVVGLGVVVLGRRDATLAAAALVVATWMAAAVQYLLQERRFRAELAGARAEMQPLAWLKVSLPLLVLDGFTLMMLNLDVLLLKLFVQPADMAVYFAAGRVISFVSFIHFAIAAVAMPRFATAYARRDVAEAGRLLRRFRLWTFAPSLLASGLFLALGPFILALFGPEFPAGWTVMAVLAAGHLARALAGPVEALLSVSNRHAYLALVTGVTAGLNMALNLLLIPRMGIVGAAMATAGAFAFQSAVLWLASRRLVREGYGERADGVAQDGKVEEHVEKNG